VDGAYQVSLSRNEEPNSRMEERAQSGLPKRREHAVALQYSESDELPKIIASGAGEIARQILELAQQHSIPIQEDAELTDMLAKLPPGAFISPETYRLVAEIISFLYHSDKKFRLEHQELKPVLGPVE
jgi:flagellar biosynthesis protein